MEEPKHFPVEKSEIPDTPTRPTTDHCGIIRVSDDLLRVIAPEIQIEDCDTQRMLHGCGVFDLIKERLLLPASYTIHFIYAEHINHTWAILVESPDLPSMSVGMNGIDYPDLDCLYCRDENGPHLVEIKARIQQTIYVKGGYSFLIKSAIGGIEV